MLSIIIPVKNMEKYISKAISSVVNDNNILKEVIVVDFGSTDNTIKIVEKEIIKSKKIKLYKIGDKNVCDARNYGLEKSKSEYVTFLDADDWTDYQYYDNIVREMKKIHAHIGFSDYLFIDELTDNIPFKTSFDSKITKKINKNYLQLISQNKFNSECWNKVYEKKFINKHKILFDSKDGVNGEDLLFNAIAFDYNPKLIYVKSNYYYHLVRVSSLGGQKRNLTDRFIYLCDYIANNCNYDKYGISTVFGTLMMQDLKKQLDFNDFLNIYQKYRKYRKFKKYALFNIILNRVTLKRKVVMFLLLINCPKIVYNKLVKENAKQN